MKSKPKRASRCNRKMVAEFDYSSLAPEFSKLSKPAQRALINNGIRTLDEILEFHGIGPSAVPVLKAVLKKA